MNVGFYVREDHSNIVEPVVLSYANNPKEIATKKFIMYHVQLPAFRKQHPTFESVKGDAFLTWLYMFDRGYKEESEMEMIAGLTDGLKNFAERYNISINDPDLLRKYRMITDGERDIATRISVAEKKAEKIGEERGEKRGEKKGEKKAKAEMVRRMQAEGLDADLIYRVAGISAGEDDKTVQ